MKLLIFFYLLLAWSNQTYAQISGADLLNEDNRVQIYHPHLKAYHTAYNYSGQWDIDGDGVKDSILFVGNGGAHAYYHLRTVLSSNDEQYDFPFLSIDMPYLVEGTLADPPTFGFEVRDFNHDGAKDIRIVLDSYSLGVSEEWKSRDVKTKDIVVSMADGKPLLVDHSNYNK